MREFLLQAWGGEEGERTHTRFRAEAQDTDTPVFTAHVSRASSGAAAWQTGHHVQWATLSSLQDS